MPVDLFHPSAAEEKQKHKLKRLIQAPNSFFMDVKCSGCFHIVTIFSHAQVGRCPSDVSRQRMVSLSLPLSSMFTLVFFIHMIIFILI
ncbi:hypothetical protein EON64_01670 [archaeon]|nr:MAG: hypothetical protein EON64_01670 [archaeon]